VEGTIQEFVAVRKKKKGETPGKMRVQARPGRRHRQPNLNFSEEFIFRHRAAEVTRSPTAGMGAQSSARAPRQAFLYLFCSLFKRHKHGRTPGRGEAAWGTATRMPRVPRSVSREKRPPGAFFPRDVPGTAKEAGPGTLAGKRRVCTSSSRPKGGTPAAKSVKTHHGSPAKKPVGPTTGLFREDPWDGAGPWTVELPPGGDQARDGGLVEGVPRDG